MKARTYMLTLAIFAAASVSCTREMLVQDLSFEFAASAAQDPESGRNLLVLERLRGADERYSFTWRFPDEEDGDLLEVDGSPFGGRPSFTVDEEGRKIFLLKGFSEGTHLLEMEITGETYTQELRQELSITQAPFHFTPAVVTEGTGRSFLMITLSEGQEKKLYTGSVILDGKTSLTGKDPIEMDFSKEAVWSVTLPYLRPGDHRLTVTLKDGERIETTTVEFTEPMKYPELELILEQDRDGRYQARVPFNPYNIRMKGQAVLRLKAQCVFVLSPPEEEIREKTVTDTSDILIGRAVEETIRLPHRDSVTRSIQQMKEKSARYKKVHVGGMTDPGWDYVVIGYEDRFYYLTDEDFIVDLEWEPLPGMELVVDNRIGDIIWNGKIRTEGKFRETAEEKDNEIQGGKKYVDHN